MKSWSLIVVCAAFTALACSASPARAQGPVGPSVFYNVTYQGTAQFTTDGQDSCDYTPGAAGDVSCFSGPFHLSGTERWTATYPAVQLSVSGTNASTATGGQQLVGTADTTDTYCSDATGGCQAGSCTFGWTAPDPGAPNLMLSGQFSGSELTLRLDAPWRPDPASYSVSGGPCQADGPYEQFPDALRAVTSIPISQLDTGTITRAVSSYDPGVYQPPSDCTAQAQADNSEVTSCSQSMLWSGTVTITPDCTSDAARVGGLAQPPCIKQKQKQDAQSAANDYRHAAQDSHFNWKVNCTGFVGRATKMDDGGKAFCWGLLAQYEYDAIEQQIQQQIAADPPDPDYTQVASPHSLKVTGLNKLRRVLPAAYRLIQRDLQVAGLGSALVTSLDRATGGFLAFSSGNQSAGADVAMQDNAILKYAAQAASLLDGQHRLALKARTELRRVASGLHGRRSARVRADILRLAASLSSAQSAKLDRLSATVLSGIGK